MLQLWRIIKVKILFKYSSATVTHIDFWERMLLNLPSVDIIMMQVSRINKHRPHSDFKNKTTTSIKQYPEQPKLLIYLVVRR